MQEEVTQKTIALYVKVGKGAARLTEQALQKAIQKFLEQKSKPAHILYRLCRFHALEAAETQAFSALNIPLATPCFAPYRSCSRALLWDG